MSRGVGQRIRELRGGKSQAVFAKEIGISFRAYRYYETGERVPPGPTLSKMAEIGGVTVDWILTGVESGAGAERVADTPAPYGLDEVSAKIVTALRELNDEGKADVLNYIEKVRPYFTERPPRPKLPRPVPIDFDKAARYFLQLYEFAESVGLGDKVDEIVERTIAELKEEHARSTKEAHGHE